MLCVSDGSSASVTPINAFMTFITLFVGFDIVRDAFKYTHMITQGLRGLNGISTFLDLPEAAPPNFWRVLGAMPGADRAEEEGNNQGDLSQESNDSSDPHDGAEPLASPVTRQRRISFTKRVPRLQTSNRSFVQALLREVDNLGITDPDASASSHDPYDSSYHDESHSEDHSKVVQTLEAESHSLLENTTLSVNVPDSAKSLAKNKLNLSPRTLKRTELSRFVTDDDMRFRLRGAGIELQNGSFIGENNMRTIVDCNVKFEPGTLSIVIGDSGSGKSHLLRAILGEFSPVDPASTGLRIGSEGATLS